MSGLRHKMEKAPGVAGATWSIDGRVVGTFDAEQFMSMASRVRTATSDMLVIDGKPVGTFDAAAREALAELFVDTGCRLLGIPRG